MKPFLTVAVPTYNRLRWLSRTLPAIIEQAKEFPEGTIEVVVSDNCSTDETWAYLQEVAASNSFLRLNRNEKNIGSEANFYLLPRLATGRYLHMIGDDDLLTSGALKRIMDALEDGPDYLILNFDAYDVLLEKCLRANNLSASADEQIPTQSDCLRRIDAMAMSFLSMWVGRLEFFNAISEEKYRYFAQWGMSIQADRYFGISHFPRGKLISTPCLCSRQNSDFKEQEFFSWFLHGSAVVLRYAVEMGVLSEVDARSRKGMLLRHAALERIRYQRRKGIFEREQTYKLLRSDYGEIPVFWLACVPIMFMPGFGMFLNVARRILGRTDP